MEFIKRNKALLLIIFVGVILRFYKLGEVPLGITNDEMGYIFNAYSIAQTGKNIFSQALPLFTWNAVPFMPGTMYSLVPIFWFLPLSAFSGRLISALFGSADIILLYILVFKLFKNKPLALLSALFLAISPWHLHFARSAYDTNVALFYYLLGIAIFIFEIQRKKFPIFSSIFFLVAFFAYRGMSVIAFPLFFVLAILAKYALKASKKQLVAFATCAFIILILFLITLKLYGQSYSGEGVSIFSNQKLTESVDKAARESEGPLFLKRIFINKPFTVISQLRENYTKFYSPQFLFLYSDQSQIYSIWSRGRLFFIDLVFIILGFAFLFRLNKKSALFITSFLLIGGLPGAFGGPPYSARNFFLSIIFPVITAGGVIFTISIFRNRNLKHLLIILISISYLYVFCGYLFDYYLRYTPQRAENWDKSLKDLSLYINQNKSNYERVELGSISTVDVMQYAFYSKISAREVQSIILKGKKYSNQYSYKIGNITTYPACPPKSSQRNILYIAKDNCYENSKPIGFIKDYFGNNIWIIWKI